MINTLVFTSVLKLVKHTKFASKYKIEATPAFCEDSIDSMMCTHSQYRLSVFCPIKRKLNLELNTFALS